jgi:hypothetical protein
MKDRENKCKQKQHKKKTKLFDWQKLITVQKNNQAIV